MICFFYTINYIKGKVLLQIKKSLRFLLISLCIMSVHNVVLSDDDWASVAEDCYGYYDSSQRKYIDFTSTSSDNRCKACSVSGSSLVLVKKGSVVLKYCLNSEISSDVLILGTFGTATACKGAGEGVSFEASGINTGVSFAKCDTCPANTYALAHDDVKHQNGLAKVYKEYNLNECVSCDGDDYKKYYTEDGECKPCPDGYRCDNTFACDMLKNGAWGGLAKCGLCVEDDYGKDGNDCKKCSTSGKVSIARFTQSMTGPQQINREHNECIEKSKCNTEGYGSDAVYGYGVNEEKNTCEKCGTGKVSQADENGIYRCVENDPCASDASCTAAGCGKVDNQCQQCGGDKPYSLTISVGDGDSYNICVASLENASCTDKSCTCNDGYVAKDAVMIAVLSLPARCEACIGGYYPDNGICKSCDGKLTTQDGLNIGCTACGANEQPNSDHTACVCKIGYGRDAENGVCRKCGGDEHPGETSVEDTEGYKCITYTSENDFGKVPDKVSDGNEEYYYSYKTCGSVQVAKYDNSRCVDVCVNTGFNGETGYGRYKKDGLSQCVKCSIYGMTAKQKRQEGYSCEEECDAYQVIQDGSCVYCSGAENIYDTELNGCISTCDDEYDGDNKLVKRAYSFTFQTPNNERHSVCTKCGPYDDFRYQNCTSCGENEWFDDTKKTGGHCQPCPKNFACNGKTKKRCPFGTADVGNGSEISQKCASLQKTTNNKNRGFLHVFDSNYENVSENDYNTYDETKFGYFMYYNCGKLNAVSKSYADSESYKQIYGEESPEEKYNGYKNMLQRDYSEYMGDGKYNININKIFSSGRDIQICEKCKDIERVVGNSCVCGQDAANPTAGQIVDIVTEGGHGTVCQGCPNGVNIGTDQAPHTCKPCSDNKGFLWDTSTNTFKCETCGGNTALYTDSSNMKLKWCLTYAELGKVVNDAGTYYQENNVWEKCPAGSCCFGGETYECVQGTYSWKGMACSGAVGNCVACQNGKTTSGKGTVCNSSDETTCQSSVCNTYIDAKKFCIKDKQNQNWCFEIAEIPMSFEKMYHITNKEPEL